MKEVLLLLVSLSAGTLFGGAFLHLLPEAVKRSGFSIRISLLVLAGVLVFFVLEKFIHWHHCHSHGDDTQKHVLMHKSHHPHHIAPLNLLGDALHNFVDGLVIAGSYLVSVPAGIATTIAVIVHEVPQELADFGVLLYSGLSKWKALLFNFMSAVTAIIGAIVGLFLAGTVQWFTDLIVPFAAGTFLYIASANLIPELHKHCKIKDMFIHLLFIILGIGIMIAVSFIGLE